MAKTVLADQNLPGGITLYGIFDWIICATSKGGCPDEPEAAE